MRDEGISAALQDYVWRAVPASDAISVEYDGGIVTLSGEVASATRARAIVDLLEAHEVVTAVVDRLRVVEPAAVPRG
jgi:osmotically-inducible protein OsmY